MRAQLGKFRARIEEQGDRLCPQCEQAAAGLPVAFLVWSAGVYHAHACRLHYVPGVTPWWEPVQQALCGIAVRFSGIGHVIRGLEPLNDMGFLLHLYEAYPKMQGTPWTWGALRAAGLDLEAEAAMWALRGRR